MGQVTDGNTLAAIFRTYPVAVGQVNAYGAAGIEVATQDGGIDDFGRDTPAFFLAEARISLDRKSVV